MTQLPLFDTPSAWEPPSLAELPSWADAARVGVDVETCDPHLKDTGPSVRTGGYLAGISFSLEDGPTHYLPIRHEGGGNLPTEGVLSYLREQAAAFRGTLVGHNLNYDLDWLAEAGVVFPNIDKQRDTMIADPLLDELQDSYSLDAIARRWGFPGKDTKLMDEALKNYRFPPGQLYRLHSRHVGAYASRDALLPLLVNRKQERALEADNLWRVYELESAVQPVLLAMKRRGVRVDLVALEKVEIWALKEESRALHEVLQLTRVHIPVDGVWQKELLVAALRAAGIELGKTPTGQPQVDKVLLKASTSPVAAKLLHARKVNRLRTTFCASVREHLVGDRIYPGYNQLATTREDGDTVGARYGRLSSEHPNIQNQPIRDEFGPMWRAIYVPDEGRRWACLDFSQQEPKMIAHYAEALGLRGAFAMAERYRTDPLVDTHYMMTTFVYGQEAWDGWDAKTRKKHRDECKNIFLGLCYGMGGGKLARMLGLPTQWITNSEGRKVEVAGPEAQAALDQFNHAVPFVRELAKVCQAKAQERGYILTLMGRRCRFPTRPDGRRDWTHKALNRLIQGSSAEQTKTAMVELHRVGLPLQLQVHDEIDASVADGAQAEAIAEVMRICVKLSVPSRVDVRVCANWGEAKAA